FLSVAEFGAVELTVDVLRGTKRAAALRVSMSQQDRLILAALVWVIDAASEGLEHDVTRMPTVPPATALKPYEELQLEGYPWFPFWQNLETREIERRADRSQP